MNKTRGLFFLIILFFLLNGCKQKIDFVDEGPFILVTSYKGGEIFYLDAYPRNIAVSNDGSLYIYTDPTKDLIIEEDAPVVKIDLTEEEIEELKDTIESNHFFDLDENISDPGVIDGDMQYVTVYSQSEVKKVGGEWPNNKRFKEIRKKVFDYAGDEYYQWLEDIEKYIYEKNADSFD